ncbi:hypothetical protein QFZ60_001776 [Arthrobacter sp. B2I5]|uniref:hypothetical protein n=1 Tax=Arthrobacter sp. B2I5 TaxID=3042266 RepID=UPI0027875861|nr:hypothetical protein [Arthrobacter sp. B2I5]MDQ0825603.1 hypothetical protein [Arthrobacter sp. B2I5]
MGADSLFELSSPEIRLADCMPLSKNCGNFYARRGLAVMLRQILVKRKKFLVSPDRTRP